MQQTILYKLVGDQSTISQYTESHKPKIITDWSGIYFQDNIEHALTCYGYRIDQGYTYCNLIKITTNTNIITIDDQTLFDNNITANTKSLLIKKKLNIPDHILLCDWLLKNNSILKCKEFVDNWEYFMPIEHNYFTNETIVNKYKINLKNYSLELTK
jgi:hypothetical protein